MNTPARGPAWDAVDTDALVAAVALDNTARPLVRQLAEVVRHRRRLTAAELERIEAAGAGVPLERLLYDLRVAVTAAWRQVVALVPSGELAWLGEAAIEFAQLAAEALARGHAARTRLGALGATGGDLFDDEGELGRRLDRSRAYGVVVFTGGDEAGAACALAGTVPGTVNGGARGRPVPHTAVAVPADCWDDVVAVAQRAADKHGAAVLAGGPVRGAAAVHDTYSDLARLVPVAREVGTGRRPDELDVHRFLVGAGPAEAGAFVRRVLGPLLDLPDDEVSTLLDRRHTDPGARQRVEQVTGLDLDRPFDRLRLDTAAVLRCHRWVRQGP